MEAIARVLAVSDGRARLACQAHSSCQSCDSGRGCGLRLLAGNRDTVLEVPDRCELGTRLLAGQVVTIAIRDAEVLRAAALAYLPLLAGLLAGALLGHAFGGPGDVAVALGGALGAAAGWAIARSQARHRRPIVAVRTRAGDAPA